MCPGVTDWTRGKRRVRDFDGSPSANTSSQSDGPMSGSPGWSLQPLHIVVPPHYFGSEPQPLSCSSEFRQDRGYFYVLSLSGTTVWDYIGIRDLALLWIWTVSAFSEISGFGMRGSGGCCGWRSFLCGISKTKAGLLKLIWVKWI